ncbi:uncharacterized protein EV422DRAFT_542380 [Fimicolochytrium jonesii]|uniref:uncharacterized protein n=1 Tax=Fimicolochytrium jonesii TaxID=1396493 RepID=UPI0022FEA36E|nr:uncharacterized protein EV422DRAFT_542380 [Fimicolochytrium jonesii]KAI8817314.1 hypothetical protein EV422DRAFT_542380 [Fimicolochytrium jonesii]
MVSVKLFGILAASFAAIASALPTNSLTPRADGPLDYPYGSSDISVIGSTYFQTSEVVYHGMYQRFYNFTATLAVRNKAFEKDVGVRWSDDNWQTSKEASAHYVANLDQPGFERWEVLAGQWSTISYLPQGDPDPTFTAYASFAKGPRVWDPRPNYAIVHKATQNNPIAYISSTVEFIPSRSAAFYLKGSVRTYAFDKADEQANKLVVRWSVDGWKTSTDTPASTYNPTDKTFAFDFPVVNSTGAPVPDKVAFAIRYDTSKGTFWYNNEGKNIEAYIPTPNV